MSHLKRLAAPRSWTLPRKGTKYVLIPYPGKMMELSMPLGSLVRDFLKLTHTRKETRAFLHAKEIMIDGKTVEEEKFPISLFDTISLTKMKQFYRVSINERGKFELKEIKEDELKLKVLKVLGKTSLKEGKIQLNLFNGRNITTDKKVSVNDSLLVDMGKNSIVKHLPLKEGAEVYILGGSHFGEQGKIKSIKERYARVDLGGKAFEIPLNNVYVIK